MECKFTHTLSRRPIILFAFAVYLSSGWALLGPLLNVFYLNRFQIIPEERALSAMFGADYASYKAKVRRWL
jgi:protein-S-isoprenylcysteine O-methyltransferase Ste14